MLYGHKCTTFSHHLIPLIVDRPQPVDILSVFAKSAAFYLGVLFFAMAVFGIMNIAAFEADFSLKGCIVLLAASMPLLAWTCWRSEEPAGRTAVTILVYSAMLVSLFLAIGLFKAVLAPSGRSTWTITSLGLAAALFCVLRRVVVRRNRESDKVDHLT